MLSNQPHANMLQKKIDYFRGELPKCQYKLGYDSAANFVPHSNLPNEDRKNPNYGIEKYDSILNTLKQMYPRPTPTDPSAEEEIGRDGHLTTIEVAIIHADIMELILSLHGDYNNSDKWEQVAQLVAEEEAIPSNLKELFEVPDLEDSSVHSRFIAKYLIDLIKVLSLHVGIQDTNSANVVVERNLPHWNWITSWIIISSLSPPVNQKSKIALATKTHTDAMTCSSDLCTKLSSVD